MSPIIKSDTGIINNKCPIPGANKVTVDNGPNNCGKAIKTNEGSSKLKTASENH